MIIGHKKQQEKLKNLFLKKQIPHALLFSGPEQVGKRTTALWFAKMINCEGVKAPCNNCRNCYEIEKNIHPDVLQVFPEKKEILLEQIAEVVERVSFRSIKANFKVVIIDEAHLMNFYAQNALLKTLEEPSERTIIILITEYPHLLLPTITSRLFEIPFFFVPESVIAEGVGNKEVAQLSFGKPGVAKNIIQFPEKKKEAEEAKKEVEKMMSNDVAEKFIIIKKVVEEERTKKFLYTWLKEAREKMIKEGEERLEENKYIDVVKNIEEVIFLQSKTNINNQLALEKIANIIN